MQRSGLPSHLLGSVTFINSAEIQRMLGKKLAMSSNTVEHPEPTVLHLPKRLTRKITGLAAAEHNALLEKQSRLRKEATQTPTLIKNGRDSIFSLSHPSAKTPPVSQAAAATLVFAQKEAGTAVCISAAGLLLTCAHCIAESAEDFERLGGMERWLLFASGRAVKAKCVAWDDRRDLALLRITAAQDLEYKGSNGADAPSFSYITVAESQPQEKTPLFCIGHPGSKDLEAEEAGQATDYDVVCISTGRFQGVAEGRDPENNSVIGALMHSCWTYWGHSGAPLLEDKSGCLVGLHSSWDVETGMRRGVPLVAIRSFLGEHAKEVLKEPSGA